MSRILQRVIRRSVASKNSLTGSLLHSVVAPQASTLTRSVDTKQQLKLSTPLVSSSSVTKWGFDQPATSQSPTTQKRELSGFSYPAPRTLAGVVNMNLFAQEPAERIKEIWEQYHAASVTAMAKVIPTATYKAIESRAPNCRNFVLPIDNENGFFVVVAQYQDKSWFVTYVEDFKKNPDAAQPYLVITIYPELSESKGLVLLRADICALATLTKTDAARILEQLVTFYGDDTHFQHVYSFNKTPREFNYESAFEAARKIKPE